MTVQAKICGLSTPETLDAAIRHGASHVGFMFYPPSPRYVTFEKAAELAARVPPRVKRVGVFVDPCNALLDQAIETGRLDVIQLHKVTPGRCAAIRQHVERETWAAIAVKTGADLQGALKFSDAADLLLYDAAQPEAATLPGGMGVRFDWRLLHGFAHRLPWGLAGGLAADNLREAFAATGAPLVDVSSGVESSPGIKDVDKIAAFLKEAAQF